MENNEQRECIPFIVFESSMARLERTIKRLVIAVIFCAVLTFTSNALWLLAWTSYDYSGTETVTVDGKDGTANYIGNDGDITNGKSSGVKNTDKNKKIPNHGER